MKKGFAIIPVLIVLTLSAIGGAFGTSLMLQKQQKNPQEETQLGTAASIQYVGNLLPIGTSTLSYEIGTTSESGDRRFFRTQIDYATTSAIDIYDSLIVGRTASTTIDELGNVTVQDLSIQGTCTGCAGAAADLQDAYNASGADAMISFNATGKDLILSLANQATDPNFVIDSVGQGQLQIAVGSTTNAVWYGDGRLGIATTSPGVGLSIQATTTLLGLDAYIYGQLNLPFIVATSTQNNSFAGALDVTEAATSTFTGGITVATGGVEINAGGIDIIGDMLINGKINNTNTATSVWQGPLAVNGLEVTGLRGLEVGGDLLLDSEIINVNIATSTFTGGLTAGTGGLESTGGLRVDVGKAIFDEIIVVAGTATSTIPTISGTNGLLASLTLTGTLEVETTGTSTFAGGISLDKLIVTNGIRVDTGRLTIDENLVVDGTATSTFAGGTTIAGIRVSAGGLHVVAGDSLFSGPIKVLDTATSTFAGDLSVTKQIRALNTIVGGTASSTVNVDCQAGNYQDIRTEDDITITMKNCTAGQTLVLGIMVDNSDSGPITIDWDGPVASGSLYWRNATDTIGWLEQGQLNLCSFRFATSTTFAYADCSGGYTDK